MHSGGVRERFTNLLIPVTANEWMVPHLGLRKAVISYSNNLAWTGHMILIFMPQCMYNMNQEQWRHQKLVDLVLISPTIETVNNWSLCWANMDSFSSKKCIIDGVHKWGHLSFTWITWTTYFIPPNIWLINGNLDVAFQWKTFKSINPNSEIIASTNNNNNNNKKHSWIH